MVFLWIIFTSEYVNPRIRAYFNNKRGIKSKEERETERASERERRFHLAFLFERRDDALDAVLYLFVVLRK